MPCHWTYEALAHDTDLEQGDILQPTAALRALLKEIHPHFGDDKYLAYIITTQSCDLVRRRDAPKAAYISIATVRPLSQVIPKIVAHVARPVRPGLFRSSKKGDARRLLERILNQNEQAIGLFFLYPDVDNAGIAEPAVAFLRVSIALRAEHYDVLRSARVGKLAPEFRAKLGWLTGNLYVRPATPDWGDTEEGKGRFEGIIRQCLEETRWVEDEIADAAEAKGVDIGTASAADLESLRPPSRLDHAVSEVEMELRLVAPAFPSELIGKLRNRLRNNGKFTQLFRR